MNLIQNKLPLIINGKKQGTSKGVNVQIYSEYGTTKTCPCCGTWNPKVKLGDGVFHCARCLYTADRDDKAALCLFVKYEAKQ
jgi:transposase